ncbi:hypothetical protein ACFOY2_39075 [Nonomuraea purpurea]|uniref:XRE family transcriptional regulator n=1 Tax=Nonomuraea purpurea TaxID=1849276 RepID=A0ABV8GK23_9ACTN
MALGREGKGLGGGEDPRQELESVACHEDLVKLLAEQFARADTSLRELETRADRAGGARLPRATCADMLAGRRFPKKALMMAFLRACRVPADQLPAWEGAWERARVARMSIETDKDRRPEPPAISTAALPLTTEPPSRGRRRAIAAAILAVLTATAALSIFLDRWGRRTPNDFASPMAPGHIITDDGRAFDRGGSSRFTVTIDPANTGVRLVRRLDAGVALQHATITVNGDPAGVWRPLPGDSIHKWRDQVVEIPRTLTAGKRTLTIVNTFTASSLGFNEFLYVVEQKLNDAWSTADTLDIGPDHTASEAAHNYQIIRQGWADTQTFAYPPDKEDWRVE